MTTTLIIVITIIGKHIIIMTLFYITLCYSLDFVCWADVSLIVWYDRQHLIYFAYYCKVTSKLFYYWGNIMIKLSLVLFEQWLVDKSNSLHYNIVVNWLNTISLTGI